MPEADLALLERTAREAGEIALGYFRGSYKTEHKPDDAGPVTEADLAVDAYLRDTLLSARPGTAWLSEETPDGPDRLDARDLFILDPIDGTRAFIEGHENWAVSLALVTDGVPVAGVVHMPAKARTYTASAGSGAFRDGAPIRTGTRTALTGATLLANKLTMEPRHWPRGVPPVKRVFRSSLAYRMCMVAEGRFDAMATFRDAWHWDIAAGALICSEAGATVTDASGTPLTFNTPTPHSPGVISANLTLHAALS